MKTLTLIVTQSVSQFFAGFFFTVGGLIAIRLLARPLGLLP